MEKKNWCRLDLLYMLNANNGKDWKARHRLRALVLVKFFQANHLTTRVLYNEVEGLRDDLKIWSSDLTEEGEKLMETGVRKWYASHDKGKAIEDVKILEKYLAKIKAATVTPQTDEGN